MQRFWDNPRMPMPPAIRVSLAVVAGYVSAVLIVLVGTQTTEAAFGIASGATPTPKHLALNVAISILGATAAGYVAARLAPPGRIAITVGVLVIVFLVMTVVSAGLAGGNGPSRSYLSLVTLLGIIGLLAGVMIERAVYGRRVR